MIMERFEELIQSEKPVLVDFYATWCGPCKMMHPILENVKGRVRIQAVPTLMLFKGGQQVWRQSGVVQSNELVSLIEQYV